MVAWDEQAYAARMRDVIRKEAIKVLNEERPPYKYGTVEQIDLDLFQVKVSYPGDPGPHTVNLLGVVPSHLGQTVQVSGRHGDRFVSGVIGMAAGGGGDDGGDGPSMAAPSGFTMSGGIEQVSADWDAVVGASRYQVQFASNAAMTTLVREFDTVSRTFTLPNIPPGQVVYGRVRVREGVGAGSTFGDWTTVKSATSREWPVEPGSDEAPPTTSPDAVVTPGIGYLIAEWLPISNQDLVTYEVHVSTNSGFTPGASTKVGETNGTFFFVKRTANGSPLAYGTTYFIRIWAKDADGPAPVVGAQGSGVPQRVELGDVGNVPAHELTDGVAPTASPTPVVTTGIRSLFLKWNHITNADPVTYEVFVGTTSGFTANANSYVGETPSNFFVVTNVGPGAGGGKLNYGTTYFVKLRSKDNDGLGPVGAHASGVPHRVEAIDIGGLVINATHLANNALNDARLIAPGILVGSHMANGAINEARLIVDGTIIGNHVQANALTAFHIQGNTLAVDSAFLNALQVGAAQIVDLAVTNAKIGNLAVSEAKIANLSVTEAKLANLAVTTAKIGNLAVTDAKIDSLNVEKLNGGTITGKTIILSNSTASILRSSNFVSGSAGWLIRGDGYAEFTAHLIGGTIKIGNNAFRVDANGNVWHGASTFASAPWRVSTAGIARSWRSSDGRHTTITQGAAQFRGANGAEGGQIYGQSGANPAIVMVSLDPANNGYAGYYRSNFNTRGMLYSYGDIFAALQYRGGSSQEGKTQIKNDLAFGALEAIRNAPAKRWKRRKLKSEVLDPDNLPGPPKKEDFDPKDTKGEGPEQIGPMIEDLPPELSPDGETISLNDLIGVLWAAVGELDEKVEALS